MRKESPRSRNGSPRRDRRVLRAALAVTLALALPGCSSSGSADEELGDPTPYTPPEPEEPDTIGYFLTRYDESVRAWTNYKLRERTPEVERRLRGLERELRQRANRRLDELIEQVETGPPINRSVAAVALGFTGDPAAQGPLLSALSDPVDDVVQNALLGLGQLGRPDTPTSEITYLMRSSTDPWIRSNAAFALQRIVASGAEGEDILVAARAGLGDEEAGVRAQCAAVVGMLNDDESVEVLSDLLYDDVVLVAAASASSLSRIGLAVDQEKGEIARTLVTALEKLDEDRQAVVLVELIRLCEANLGDEAEDYKEWAYKLP